MTATAFLCLALNVYFEARNQPYMGQVAVATVTLNRAEWRKDGICGAVAAKGQFSWVGERTFYTKKGVLHVDVPKLEPVAWGMAKNVARRALNSKGRPNFYYFHRKDVNPAWSRKKILVADIGDHYFYAERNTNGR